jgi:hypothetical protein
MKRWIVSTLLLLSLVAGFSACGTEPEVELSPPEGEEIVAFELASPAFDHEGTLPPRYSCDGDNESPPIRWNDEPEGTESFALIMDDPDAPGRTFVHWVIYNLPPLAHSLETGVNGDADLPEPATHGENSRGDTGYTGPCPPGGTHRYFFKLYALDMELDLDPGATKQELLDAMDGHVLGQAELMGRYQRQ